MPAPIRNSWKISFLVVALSLLLSSCSHKEKHPAPVVPESPLEHVHPLAKPKPPQTMVSASDYARNLMRAELGLARGDLLSDITQELEVIERYNAQSADKASPVTLAVLRYKTLAGIMRSAAAPIGATEKNYAELQEVITRIDGKLGTLYDIAVRDVTPLPKPLSFKGQDIGEVLELLRKKRVAMLQDAVRPTIRDEARAQMMLLEFFLQQKRQQAAYLCADNTRHLLEEMVENNIFSDDLAKKLQKWEGRLREEMPY